MAGFEELVEECWKLSKTYDYYSRKLEHGGDRQKGRDVESILVKMYSVTGQPVLLRCLGLKNGGEMAESEGEREEETEVE